MIVGVLTTCHTQYTSDMVSFYGVTSRIRFMFLLFPQVSRNWRCEPEPPFKPSPLICYKQFGTNSVIVLMFVESQKCTYRAPVRCCCYSTTPHVKIIPLSRQLLKMGTRWPETCWATYKEQLIGRNKYNTKWHLVGFLFHTCKVCNKNLECCSVK